MHLPTPVKKELDLYFMMLHLSVKFEWNCCIPLKVINLKPQFIQKSKSKKSHNSGKMLRMTSKFKLDLYLMMLYPSVNVEWNWCTPQKLLIRNQKRDTPEDKDADRDMILMCWLCFEQTSTGQNDAWQSLVTILHTIDWTMLKWISWSQYTIWFKSYEHFFHLLAILTYSDYSADLRVVQFYYLKLSQCMRFPTMWYVRRAKPQSLCLSPEYSMIVKLLTEHHLEFLSLKGGCRGSSESTLVKMPHCWKFHALAQL